MLEGFSPVQAGTDKEERQFHRLTKIAVNTAPDSYLQLSMPPLTAVCLRPVRLSQFLPSLIRSRSRGCRLWPWVAGSIVYRLHAGLMVWAF